MFALEIPSYFHHIFHKTRSLTGSILVRSVISKQRVRSLVLIPRTGFTTGGGFVSFHAEHDIYGTCVNAELFHICDILGGMPQLRM